MYMYYFEIWEIYYHIISQVILFGSSERTSVFPETPIWPIFLVSYALDRRKCEKIMGREART